MLILVRTMVAKLSNCYSTKTVCQLQMKKSLLIIKFLTWQCNELMLASSRSTLIYSLFLNHSWKYILIISPQAIQSNLTAVHALESTEDLPVDVSEGPISSPCERRAESSFRYHVRETAVPNFPSPRCRNKMISMSFMPMGRCLGESYSIKLVNS